MDPLPVLATFRESDDDDDRTDDDETLQEMIEKTGVAPIAAV
jgi:hypothetical protein